MSEILRTLLVAVDGSPSSEAAIAFALRLARRHGSGLLWCHAIDPAAAAAMSVSVDAYDPEAFSTELDAHAHGLLAPAMDRARALGLSSSIAVIEGRPAEAIVALARERRVDAIVVGTRGTRGLLTLFIDSTAESVLELADAPVFVVHSGTAEHEAVDEAPPAISPAATGPMFRRIVVAFDDSEPAKAAAAFATELAAADRGELVFCHDLRLEADDFAYEARPAVEEWHESAESLVHAAAERAAARGVQVDHVVTEGDPTAALLEVATARHADLIAVGTHGRRGLERLWFGSVAEAIVQRSPIPVVTVRSAAVHAAEEPAAPNAEPNVRSRPATR